MIGNETFKVLISVWVQRVCTRYSMYLEGRRAFWCCFSSSTYMGVQGSNRSYQLCALRMAISWAISLVPKQLYIKVGQRDKDPSLSQGWFTNLNTNL